jgi:hypothetical protein
VNLPLIKKSRSTTHTHVRAQNLMDLQRFTGHECILQFTVIPAVISTTSIAVFCR